MTLNPIRAWFAEAKVYVFGFLLVMAGAAYWYHGHESYKAGKLAGDKEVAALKAQYTTAYANAQASAKALQAEYDAQALADANALAAKQAVQLADVSAQQRQAQAQAADFAQKLKKASKHDPATAAWVDARIPAAVLHAAGASDRQ